MYGYKSSEILTDADALDEESLLEDPLAREEQMKELWFCMSPLERGKTPFHCWLHGEPGTGKTAMARFVLGKLESMAPVKGVYVNCWEKNTFFGILDRMITELKILGPERPATGQKLDLLQRYLKDKNLVVILDDIDRPSPGERNSIIYNLCNLQRMGLICISKSTSTIFDLDDRIKSRLNAVPIEFPRYTAEELKEILTRRAEQALAYGSWTDQIPRRISELAAGDARIAIKTLKNAAYHAQKESGGKIRESHVMKGWHDTRQADRNHLLGKLTCHHSTLLDVIKEKGEVLSNELWKAYLEKCKENDAEPISTRTFPDYVNELRDMGLVRVKRAPVKGKVRAITAV
jgi:cell division control protein 6